MMDIKQITKILGCGRQKAIKRMLAAGINTEKKSFSHGKKFYYNVTEEQLRELMVEKDPEQMVMSQAQALMALESMFNRKINPEIHGRHFRV